VPGLGISQLARQDGIDAVLVTPWRWDGQERRRADQATVRRTRPMPRRTGCGGCSAANRRSG
jgi:hypothetical protein